MVSYSTCLITGGAGFIGCGVASALADRFPTLIALDNLHPQIHASRAFPPDMPAYVEGVLGDVTDAAAWDQLLARVRPDIVLHLAAETGTGQSLTEAARHTHVNVTGTAVMLDAFSRHDFTPRRIVLASSRAVYGEGAWRAPGDQPTYPGQRSRTQLAEGRWDFDGAPMAMDGAHTRPAPVSVYGATKLAQENILSSWCNATGTELVTFRFQNVYGPGQSLKNSYTGIVSLFCQLARAGKSIPLYEDGRMMRDFVFIGDAADAIVAAMFAADAAGRVFDIGSGVGSTIADAAFEIARSYGAPAPHITAQYRYGDVRHAWADIALAGKVLEWTPKVALPDGLRRLKARIDADLDKAA